MSILFLWANLKIKGGQTRSGFAGRWLWSFNLEQTKHLLQLSLAVTGYYHTAEYLKAREISNSKVRPPIDKSIFIKWTLIT